MIYLLMKLLVTAPLAAAGGGPTTLHDPDLMDLSLLPLDKLLAMKRALSYEIEDTTATSVNDSSTPFHAQALRGDPGNRGTTPPRRGGPPPIWIEEVDVWKGGGGGGWSGGKGKGGLQSIFQGTVTVLAFLAFGGYLLCLVLNALRQKTAALEMTLLTTVAPATRRRRTLQLNAAKPTADRAYMTMRSLAEAYVKYDQRCSSDCNS